LARLYKAVEAFFSRYPPGVEASYLHELLPAIAALTGALIVLLLQTWH
jgi:hypothetical protein